MSRTSNHTPKPILRSGPRSGPRPLIGANLERCIFCAGTKIVKRGRRHKKHETIQRWYCRTCDVSFTPQTAGKGSPFPLKVTLEALCMFYTGHTLERAAQTISKRFGLSLHPRTLARWLADYRELTTYARLRNQCRRQFTPHQLIRSTRLHHKQVYQYRIHHGKLAHVLRSPEHQRFHLIANYLADMAISCPHHLFQGEHRASQDAAVFDLTQVEITEKQNLAPRIAGLVLQTVTHNKRRHDELQHFMLTTDSVTVAVEVPIYLTPEDVSHMQQELGFAIPLPRDVTLSGHIDVLQIRNGRIHIVDYKPNAHRERPITQLMVYALALSRRTGLRLYDFVCAWFDDQHYYEFYPLHVVHKRGVV